MRAVRMKIGMVFQEGALFDSLTVGENVGYRLVEDGRLDEGEIEERVREMLGFVGLDPFYERMPSELSGGQRRRVAVARALVARPQIMLYDEPTTGLDPMTSLTVDREIIKLRDLEGVTSVLVTHQLRDAFYIATNAATRTATGHAVSPAARPKVEEADFVMLRDGRIVFEGSADELRASTDPYLREFLS
jgi:phospholipid/cholesterol/gamma-HCH transport system ATP-binding protein